MFRAGVAGAGQSPECHEDDSTWRSPGLRRRLEDQRLHELLSKRLSPAMSRIAVIGRGPGSDVSWLRRTGKKIEVLEFVDESRAGWLATQEPLPWTSDSIDVVLMSGPMYSLEAFSERASVIRDAGRVLRPGGLLAVVAVNRTARLIGATLTNLLLQRSTAEFADRDAGGRTVVSHSVDELAGELSPVSSRVEIYGVTGPGGWLVDVLDAHFSTQRPPRSLRSPSPLATALAAAELADSLPELRYASPLLFAVGKRNEHGLANNQTA